MTASSAQRHAAVAPGESGGPVGSSPRGVRPWVGLIARVVLAAALLFWAVRTVSWPGLRPWMVSADGLLIAVAAACGAALVGLRAARFRLLLGVFGGAVSFGTALRATLAGAAARLGLPGRTGDLMRPLWLDRRAAGGAYVAAGLDLAAEAAAVLLLAVPGLSALAGPVAGAAAVLLAVGLAALVRRPGGALRRLGRLPGLGALSRESAARHGAGSGLSPGAAAGVLLLGIGAGLLRVGIPVVVWVAIGAPVPLAVWLVVPLVLLLEGAPITVGGLGVREAAGIALLVPLGLPAEGALVGLAGLFVFGTLLPGAVGLWFLLRPRGDRPRRPLRLAAGAVLVCLLAGGAPETAARQGAAEAVVFLARSGQPARVEGTIRAVWAQLSDVHVDLRVRRESRLPDRLPEQVAFARRVAKEHRCRAVFWYGTAGGSFSLLLLGAGGDRLVTRKVAHLGSEGRAEAVALIVRTALLAHRAGQAVGRPAPRAPAADPPPRKRIARRAPTVRPASVSARRPAPVVPQRRVSLGLAWGASLHAREALVATGARVHLWVRLPRGFRVGLASALELPIDVDGAVARLQLRRVPLTVEGAYLWRSGRLVLGASLGAGLLVQTTRLGDVEDDYVVAARGPDLAFALEPALLVGAVLRRGLRVLLGLGVRVVAPARTYVARSGDSGEPVEARLLGGWPVQPLLWLGLDVGLL